MDGALNALLRGALATLGVLTLGQADARVFRAADIHPTDYPTVQAVRYMGEVLEELSGGKHSIRVYYGRQLGEERDTLEQAVFGAVDINRLYTPVLNNVVAETKVLSLPFIFRSLKHRDTVLNGPIGQQILDAMLPFGLVGLAFYDSGVRSFYTPDTPIRRPEDMAGLRLRVPNSDVSVDMVEALGANATPMEFGQIFEGLRNGTIDGAENNWPSYTSTRHFEIARVLSLTEHSMVPEVLVMSKLTWDKLSEQEQAWVREAARRSVGRMRELWNERVAVAREKVRAAGNTVIDGIDKQPFMDAVQPVYDQHAADPVLADLVRRIREVPDD